jgi:hypothetical protein
MVGFFISNTLLKSIIYKPSGKYKKYSGTLLVWGNARTKIVRD